MTLDFLNDLNASQRAAVEYVDGPSLVIAGAGSGKTRVLTYKIAYLLELGLKPWNILALTFTNKAAREMRERIEALVGPERSRGLWMGTFHSVFNRILRREAEKIDFLPNYTIYQPSDTKSLIKSILKELSLDEKEYKPGAVAARISEAKNALVTWNSYVNDEETYKRDTYSKMPAVGEIYKRYVLRCHQANAMDFDDLLLYTYMLFKTSEETRQKYARAFRFLLVDEYQDTNFAQHQIMLQLRDAENSICVVGDDAQSIYSFRGAKIDNILKFTRQYDGARLFKLEQNYRSTQNIVGAANSLISCNQEQIRKEVFSENEPGQPLLLTPVYSDVEEGEVVSRRMQTLHGVQRLPYSQMAVLYRTNAQSRIFEEALRKKMIPYRIYGGRSFYDRKEVRDVLAYFRLIVNPNDEEAFKRIVNYPSRGIGDVTLGKVVRAAAEQNCGVWDVLERPKELGLDVSAGTLGKLEKFRAMMADFMQVRDQADAYVLGNRVIRESGLHGEAYRNNLPENKEMQDNLSELLNGMHAFVELQREVGDSEHVFLADYLSEVALLSDTDDRETEGKDMVTLMTVHAAKGLEFDAIFVAGMEENLFPNAMSMNSQRELEEERRLFYVAITRARKYCFLSCAKMRFRYGSMDFCEPSRFLKEIDKRFIRMEMKSEPKGSDRGFGGTSSRFAETTANKRSGLSAVGPAMPVAPRRLRPMPSNNDVKTAGESHQSLHTPNGVIRVGQHVVHDRFGEGSVLALEGTNEMVKARIRFVNMGEKTLLLKFAKLKFLD